MAQENEKDNEVRAEQAEGTATNGTVVEETVENAGEAEEQQVGPDPRAASVASPVNEQLVRLRADFDNYRRRTEKEKYQERQRGRRDAAEKLLPVFDSLTMGLLTTKADNAVRVGLEAVYNQLLSAFQSLGLQKVPTKGETFDPQLHEAIARMPSEEFAEGIIIQESRAGFTDEVGLLRPAQVVVSAGKPE